MDKYDLIRNADVKNDIARLRKLEEYDYSVGGMKIYRYRPLDEEHIYELDALKSCRVWATNPNLFDDEYELYVSKFGPKDFKYIDYLIRRDAKKKHYSPYPALRSVKRMGCRNVATLLSMEYRKQRGKYVASCFTENSPEGNENMWRQYARDHGICLEYSLKTFVKAHVIIDPVYYIETKSFGDIFEFFGEQEQVKLLFCVKDKYGIDKYTGERQEWEQQREWRYLLYNEVDGKGKYKTGRYIDRIIKPDAIYVKGLSRDWIKKVKNIAEVNCIPVKINNPKPAY